MWTSVLAQLLSDESRPDMDTLVTDEEPDGTPYDTAKDIRERALFFRDPVRRVNAYEFVQERLGDLVKRTGGEQMFRDNHAVNVDKEVLVEFQRLGQPPQEAP